jgi:protoporphyrin/coproporphyrin ferrochelatase
VQKKIGVVLFQLGGPDRPDAVEAFLYQLFCDPDIINFPLAFLARKPLAKLISSARARVVSEHYQTIGGASPIRALTELQAHALEESLRPYADAKVVVAMRYWHPFTNEAIAALKDMALDELVLLPLYPQYSFATTRSSLKEWNRLYTPNGVRVRVIENFHKHPSYIAAMVERIESAMDGVTKPDELFMVFSAHGLPMSLIKKGDPYQRHIEETGQLIRTKGKWPNRHVLCYQSRVGPQKWLAPSLTDTIQRLAGEKVRRMLIVPLSFVTEHIETLHEINIEARELAKSLGVEEFRMMPALNDSALFIGALTELVLRATDIGR